MHSRKNAPARATLSRCGKNKRNHQATASEPGGLQAGESVSIKSSWRDLEGRRLLLSPPPLSLSSPSFRPPITISLLSGGADKLILPAIHVERERSLVIDLSARL